MSEKTIENVREYNFDPKEVIKGLNGYYESDKCNSYITVRRNDVEGPAYLSTNLWLSALIEWLRVDYEIFYRPGLIFDQVETARNAAKMCCLRAHIKDEISKRGLFYPGFPWCNKDVDIPELVDTLFRAYDECKERADKNRAEIREVNDKRWEDLRDIYKALGCDGMNGHIDDFAKAVKARAEYVESLARNAEIETQKSDINKLIRDYCTKHNIVAPSPYFSDKDCVEYLFSVVDLERKHRAAVGKQMVDDYEKDLLKFIHKEYEHRTHLSDKIITYNPPNICNTITKIISDYARSRTRVDILEGRIKSIFDRCKTDFTADDHVINGDPTTSFMLDCITCAGNSDRYISDRIRSSCKAHGVVIGATLLTTSDWSLLVTFLCNELKKLKSDNEANNDVIKKLKGLLNEINKEEDEGWFKP